MRNTVGIDVLLLLLLTTINGLVALSDAHSLDFNCHFHIWQLRNTFVDRYARRPLQRKTYENRTRVSTYFTNLYLMLNVTLYILNRHLKTNQTH